MHGKLATGGTLGSDMNPALQAMPRASILIVCHRHVDLLLRCLESLQRNVSGAVAAETIVLFNGTPEADRGGARRALADGRVIVSEVNLGFGGGNNRAAEAARGEYLVMLNDDAEVQPGWLEALIETGDEHPDAGAVGSRILHPGGWLQEAGSVVWSDASTIGVGRGLPPGSRRYEYLREVDYASACSLLIRRETFERVGGFDQRFFPAYNEDVDLCFAIRRLGQRVLYQPRSVIVHHESQSGADAKTFLILRGRRLLREKWARELRFRADPRPTEQTAIDLAVHRARGGPPRVLVIDDRLPDQGLGSGFGRMRDAIRELAGVGYAISVYATDTARGDRRELQDLGVDVIEGDLVEHLSAPATFYDAAIVSRPHNFKLVPKLRRHQSQCVVIYDAEALFHRRLEREAEVLIATDPQAAQLRSSSAGHARRLERKVVLKADRVVSVSTVEAEWFRSIPKHCPIDVIEGRHPEARTGSRPFAERSGMVLVAGWLAPYPSPNSDGLEWFVDSVLPRIKEALPWARLSVTGANPPAEITRLAGPSLRFLGHVDDLGRVYDAARLAVVPVRYGAGIKNKALEALQYGVPVVATVTGAEGIEGAGGPGVAVSDDPDKFAEHVIALLNDRLTWDVARMAISEIQARWASGPTQSWARIVETALRRKTIGSVALHS